MGGTGWWVSEVGDHVIHVQCRYQPPGTGCRGDSYPFQRIAVRPLLIGSNVVREMVHFLYSLRNANQHLNRLVLQQMFHLNRLFRRELFHLNETFVTPP